MIDKRINQLDLIKSMAIIEVVILHSNIDEWNWLVHPGILPLMRYFIRSLLATAVPLFLFVNGCLVLNKKLNIKNHLVKTIKLAVLALFWGGYWTSTVHGNKW